MMLENQDDSFVLLQKKEVTQLKQEALNAIRFGNHCLDKQFERDIELLSLAIIEYGLGEHDRLTADNLLKSVLLLFFSQVFYRHCHDQRFYPLDTLNSFFKKSSTLTRFPIAALLLHGSRVLIEFPSEIAREITAWLIDDRTSWRYLATHRISPLKEAEVVNNKNNAVDLHKFLKEEKISATQAAFHFMSDSFTSLMATLQLPLDAPEKPDLAEHYGFNLALGGAGNLHFASKEKIQNNGEHGHLYLNFYRGEQKEHSGLLLGIEQSAPGKSDQFGCWHDLTVNDKHYSASGGDFFCKKPYLLEIYQKDYQGLTTLPLSSYYDSLWSFISKDAFTLIKTSFEKCKGALTLLNKEKKMSFIRGILTSSGNMKSDDFTQWFNAYFREIFQKNLTIQREKEKYEIKEKIQFQCLENKMQWLSYENEQFKKKLTELQQHASHTQKINNLLLYNLSKCFMLSVIQQMGWRVSDRTRKVILKEIQEVSLEVNENPIRNLLKNFISANLISHCGVNYRSMYFVKVCVTCLNLQQYQPLIILLFFKTNKINAMDLFRLITNNEIKHNSNNLEKYRKNNSFFHQKKDDFRENQSMVNENLFEQVAYIP